MDDTIDIKIRAAQVRTLQQDPVFQDVMQTVRDAQVAVFLNPKGSPEAREEAHAIIRALGLVDRHLTGVLNEEAVFDKRQQKDQHRGND